MFYPPKGVCKADTEGGPIVFTYVLFWLRKRILDFQRNSAKQIPKKVQLFLLMSYFVLGNVYRTFNLQTVFCLFRPWKCFIPKWTLQSIAHWGPFLFFSFFSIYCGLRWVFDTFNIRTEFRQKKNLKKLYLMGWVGQNIKSVLYFSPYFVGI